ncbi:hypothetical protein BUALT_Bualt02G0040600 [Buddleja alternifolia]|uniref:Transcription factor IIIC 90kDa subunit N-terminal domain-containing protein n=1 Tax=Buddleja alternifolia TaxID=168488 RepID=A0AAV6Y863_9LAMI|nr:hypothetical protein BUALT_Bualt02G0040600 [Buddleja alternifolia]
MSSRFQSAMFGSSLVYPNAVVWSEENLVAVACTNTVLILNPENPGVRGVVTVPSSKPFPLGVVDGGGEDLLSGCLLPFHLSRDTRPCVRSISWSPSGLANNAGCLLAVCTTGGRVKLYRFPFCEFSAEWIEVKSTYFGECEIISSESSDVILSQDNGCANDPPICSLRNDNKRRRTDAVAAKDLDNLSDNVWQIVPFSDSNEKLPEKVSENCKLPLVTVQQYASRNTMLTAVTVSWSPILRTSENDLANPDNTTNCCSILAIGGKCGRISFWRIHAPERYSIVSSRSSGKSLLVGLLRAHEAWITAISWALYDSSASNPHFVLATGSSDGRVKIWQVNGEELLKSSEVNHASFSLLKEVMTDDSATVSILSLTVPSHSPQKLLLAIGKGSGSFEVWVLDMSANKFEKVGCYNAHDRIVTGLAWAFDGRCLYSCSQDNSMKSWIFVGNSLCEVLIPSSSLGLKNSPDVPFVFDSCFGLAVSPGNLATAVARRFDADLLNPMYQARTQRTSVEFLWIGGQQMDLSSTVCPLVNNEAFPGLSKTELVWWQSNILWSLNQFENSSRVLIIWDIIAALLALKQSVPKYVDDIILKWLTSYFRSQFGISTSSTFEALKSLPKLSSRQLHLINIIGRRVVLKECKADNLSSKKHESERVHGADEEHVNLWMELLRSSESELLERLVGFTFSASLSLLSCSSNDPNGLSQMEQWVSLNEKNVKDHSKFLAAEVRKVDKRRLQEENEPCNFCSAVVPFESREYAICSGVNCDTGVIQRHKLERCSITMRVRPIKPSWYCMCCKRWATKLAPTIIFTMPEYSSDFKSLVQSSSYRDSSTPFCPFCGILLQRSQPEYSLSPSPV